MKKTKKSKARRRPKGPPCVWLLPGGAKCGRPQAPRRTAADGPYCRKHQDELIAVVAETFPDGLPNL